jgi:hypothetical protein
VNGTPGGANLCLRPHLSSTGDRQPASATRPTARGFTKLAENAQGDVDLRRWALNVDPAEGDLTTVPSQDLLSKLEPVKVTFHQADQYQQEEAVASGYNLSQLVMIALVCLLLGEQALAYSASYHPHSGGVR